MEAALVPTAVRGEKQLKDPPPGRIPVASPIAPARIVTSTPSLGKTGTNDTKQSSAAGSPFKNDTQISSNQEKNDRGRDGLTIAQPVGIRQLTQKSKPLDPSIPSIVHTSLLAESAETRATSEKKKVVIMEEEQQHHSTEESEPAVRRLLLAESIEESASTSHRQPIRLIFDDTSSDDEDEHPALSPVAKRKRSRYQAAILDGPPKICNTLKRPRILSVAATPSQPQLLSVWSELQHWSQRFHRQGTDSLYATAPLVSHDSLMRVRQRQIAADNEQDLSIPECLRKADLLLIYEAWQGALSPQYAGQDRAWIANRPDVDTEFAVVCARPNLGWEYCGHYKADDTIQLDIPGRALLASDSAKYQQGQQLFISSQCPTSDASDHSRFVLQYWHRQLTTALGTDVTPAGPEWLQGKRAPTDWELACCSATSLAARARALGYSPDMKDKELADLLTNLDERHELTGIQFVRYDEKVWSAVVEDISDLPTAREWYSVLKEQDRGWEK